MNIIESFKVLGAHQRMSDEDITACYRKAAMACHPDRGGEPGRFEIVKEAYGHLKGVPPHRRIERMKILGKECPVCSGLGIRTKQRGWTNIVVGPCANCGGAGYITGGRA